MIAKSAKTVAEFRAMVDELGNLIDKMLKTDNDRDLSQSESELSTAFRGLQYNVYVLAGETKRQLDSHRANIRYGKAEQKVVDMANESAKEDIKKAVEYLQSAEAEDSPVVGFTSEEAKDEFVKKVKKTTKKKAKK